MVEKTGMMPHRGSIWTVALQGDYGKPRPAVVIQANRFIPYPTLVICPFTTELREDIQHFRLVIAPSESNSLRRISQIMLDKPSTVDMKKIGNSLGQLTADELSRMNAMLAMFLAID